MAGVGHDMAGAGDDLGGAGTMEDLFGEDEQNVLAAAVHGDASAPEPNTTTASVTINDLFGDDFDVREQGTSAMELQPSGAAPQGKPKERKGKKDPSAELHLPSLPRLSDANISQVSLVRMPRIVGTAPSAYDADTYDEAAELQYLKSVDRQQSSETLVRYRFKRDSSGDTLTDADGRPLRESNARVVEWHDGSLTLHVGKEVLSLRRAAGDQGQCVYVYARVQSLSHDAHGVSVGRRETVLEAQAAVSARFVVGGDSASAVVQQSVLEARAARSRALKRQRVTQIAVTEDLEEEKARRIRAEDEASRALAAQRRKADAARVKDRARGYGLGLGLEDDLGLGAGGEDGEFDLKALKVQAKRGASKRRRGGDEDEDGEGGYNSQSQEEEEDG